MSVVLLEKDPQNERAPNFADFWEARKDSMKAWGQMTDANQRLAVFEVHKHVARWQAIGTERHMIPMPATWLRGERFLDEIELPKPQRPAGNWWASEATIMAKGAEMGLTARPGESLSEFRGRIQVRIDEQ